MPLSRDLQRTSHFKLKRYSDPLSKFCRTRAEVQRE